MAPAPAERLPASEAGIRRASEWLARGGLVAFPTETVYGLGADARNSTAVARIFEAKGRPSFNPLIVHVHDMNAAHDIAEFPDDAERLASAFWPGPLTLVLPLRAETAISPLVTAGLETIGLRMPAHPLAQKLLARFGGPVAAPSANTSGRISPTRPEHVLRDLGAKIDAVLDGGACDVGVESTIVGFFPEPTLLRPGGLPREAIEDCLGRALARADAGSGVTSPGQLSSHYAPASRLRLNATERKPGEVLLGFGAVEADLNLSPSGNLVEAAANLFEYLHRLDASGPGAIAVSPIPDHGLGAAINDRLRRAAAPRAPNGSGVPAGG